MRLTIAPLVPGSLIPAVLVFGDASNLGRIGATSLDAPVKSLRPTVEGRPTVGEVEAVLDLPLGVESTS